MGAGLRQLAAVAFLALLPLAHGIGAEHYEARIAEPEAREGVAGTIDETHERVSRFVIELSRDIDRFLGTEAYYRDYEYDSILRLEFAFNREAGENSYETGIGGSVSLPGTEERLQLVFDSDDPDDPAVRDREGRADPEERQRQFVGLRFLRSTLGLETATSARVRSGDPIDLRTRIEVWRDFEPARWHIRPRATIFNSERTGTGYTGDIRIDHPVGHMRARSSTGATWFRREEQFYYDQTFSLLQPLGRRRDLTWEIGADGESEPEDRLTLYYAQVRLRTVIHRDWLVAELRPQWRRDIENDFGTEFRLYFGLDVLFGHHEAY